MASKQEVERDLAEIKITLGVMKAQIKSLEDKLGLTPMYTNDEYHEIAQYRKTKK